MSDAFTQSDLDFLHNKWRKILGITMNGKCELVDKIDDAGSLGYCTPQKRRNYYSIKVLNPNLLTQELHEKDWPPDVEDTLVHEILHVKTWWLLSKPLSEVEADLYESNVDWLAGVLVRLHRGQT